MLHPTGHKLHAIVLNPHLTYVLDLPAPRVHQAKVAQDSLRLPVYQLHRGLVQVVDAVEQGYGVRARLDDQVHDGEILES